MPSYRIKNCFKAYSLSFQTSHWNYIRKHVKPFRFYPERPHIYIYTYFREIFPRKFDSYNQYIAVVASIMWRFHPRLPYLHFWYFVWGQTNSVKSVVPCLHFDITNGAFINCSVWKHRWCDPDPPILTRSLVSFILSRLQCGCTSGTISATLLTYRQYCTYSVVKAKPILLIAVSDQ